MKFSTRLKPLLLRPFLYLLIALHLVQVGTVAASVNLTGTSARIILNEVTSTHPSQLRGFTEVVGIRSGAGSVLCCPVLLRSWFTSAAEVVIANPNGITCDGCGFINTPRAVLSTGTPVFGAGGSLDAYRVTAGVIDFQGSGLNATALDRTNLRGLSSGSH